MSKQAKIGVVGPCAAGKSTLIAGLKKHGYEGSHIAQEHSYVPAMWQKMTRPDLLIFLDVSYEKSMERRKINWSAREYEEQLRRLVHARQHADLIIETNELSPQEVLELALAFINIKV
jgi:deoxyadenosine/deoxycytidine kinase